MRQPTTTVLVLALCTIGFAGTLAAADSNAFGSFDAYLEAAAEEGIEGDERTLHTLVPAGMGLEVTVDFETFEVQTSVVDPAELEQPASQHEDANCLVTEPGERRGLTPGAPIHVDGECQDRSEEHTTGSESMRFVTAGDDEAMFRLQRSFDEGWGWVWIECGQSGYDANFVVGPFDDLQHTECYMNNYGNPATWGSYTAYVDNGHGSGVSYGSISYVS